MEHGGRIPGSKEASMAGVEEERDPQDRSCGALHAFGRILFSLLSELRIHGRVFSREMM